MPEGDTIHYAAGRIRPVLEGHVPDELATPHARFARDRWPERLAGRAGLPCPRCGAESLIRAKAQWDDNRTTFWCPRCQT
jgi:formamidopyrimidine-DNA glycosylase